MLSIEPVRTVISRRLPTAAFSLRVPPRRPFEIACATDPRLFGGAARSLRQAANFYTSRLEGWLFAPSGRANYSLPPEVLLRLAWARRLYYVLAVYDSTHAERGAFAPAPGPLSAAPFLRLSPDLHSAALRRPNGMAAPTPRAAVLAWGGDAVFAAALPEE